VSDDKTASVRPAGVEARGWAFRHASRLAWAVDGLDLSIEPGERVLLLGPSGAGKSTLIHALAGVLGDTADEGESRGSLLIDGMLPAAVRGRAGLVLQDPDSQVILARVGDDVAFGCENLGVDRDEIWRRVAWALDAVGLDVALDHPTSQLSGGQKQRLALAGVLAMHPGLLLLDEPTANLDPAGVAEVRDAVTRVLERTGATLVVIEHRVDTWASVVDRVVVLEPNGGVSADGSIERVLGDAATAERLRDAGVWVPGWRPEAPARRTQPGTSSGFPAGSAPDAATGAGTFAGSGAGSGAGADEGVLLRAIGLSVGRPGQHPVQTDLALELRNRELLAIEGPNGAGKSTLALTLAGLLAPQVGSVTASDLLRGDNRVDVSPHRWRSRELLTRIGMVFQDPEHQILKPTVREDLLVGPRAVAGGRSRRALPADILGRVDEVLERLRLAHLAEANPYTLSGGEKRRLSVATALVTEPRVLVLDEPTFGQDARTWRELVALLSELRDDGTSIVAVSHDADFVRVLADRRLEVRASSAALRTDERFGGVIA
jgi:energy-coupling factor transporter ATP-binding protein EcfA2